MQEHNIKALHRLVMSFVALLTWSNVASAQHWVPVTLPFPGEGAGTALLRTDGNVMVQETGLNGSSGTGTWYLLVPDDTGSYQNGAWYTMASTTGDGYAPLFFGSAVLPDSRIIFEGGEYNFTSLVETPLGFIYNEKTDSFKPVSPPKGWKKIGDGPTVVLPDKTFMMGSCCSAQQALLNKKTLTWTSTGAGKADANSEEGWTLLPNGKVLTVDTQNATRESELYDPSTGTWSLAGKLPVDITYNCGKGIPEVGPAVLRPDGTVFAAGANGFTAIYDSTTGKWSKGPIFPPGEFGQNAAADGPAAILPGGNVLVMASNINPCNIPPSYFFEFDGSTFNPVPAPPNAGNEISSQGRMLVLPNGGHVLFTDGTKDVEVFIANGSAKRSWAPQITSFPSEVTRGKAYTIEGTQFNGLTQGAAYGDDAQMATNFPLVRITHTANGHVHYARTKGFSTMGVATGSAIVSTKFIPPTNMAAGPATMVVVANGIASDPVSITVK
jgi:hypothetical protein